MENVTPKTQSSKAELRRHRFIAFLQHRVDLWMTTRRARRWSNRIWWGRKNGRGELLSEARLIPKAPRAEAIRLVLRSLCQFVQVGDGCRIVRFHQQRGIDRQWLCNETGLSIYRVKRALMDLYAAGILGGYQPRERRPGGECRGRACIRWVKQKLLDFLGLWDELVAARKLADQRAPIRRRPPLPERGGNCDFAAFALRLRL